MLIGIVQFPGSNCERETILAVKRAGMEPVEFLWNESVEKLRALDGYIIVGGFSYEDRSRAGIIAALDPVMSEIKTQSKEGKPVLGICNGAQILVETGLVPGLENNKVGMSLSENKRIADGKVLGTGFYNAWIHMRLSCDYQRNAFTQCMKEKDILQIPVAHAEGRFVMSEALLQEIMMQGLHVFQYCDATGNIIDSFPINPNGSLANIAAISNKAGNVMAIMPHPERCAAGDVIFQSMREYIASSARKRMHSQHAIALYYYPRQTSTSHYKKPEDHVECIVASIITDNHAFTVQNTLHHLLPFPVTVKRYIHWEIACDSELTVQRIKKSGLLFNERKEKEVTGCVIQQEKINTGFATHSFLVSAKDNLLGQQIQQTLLAHFNISGIRFIRHSVLWHFTCEEANMTHLKNTVLTTHIIFNSYGHDWYHYANRTDATTHIANGIHTASTC